MTTLHILTPTPEADAARRAGLRRMRTVAVSLLALAAVVYVATLRRHGFLGYVNSGAEASMVGAIADWFAVTALFKHPLGIPIPHTALIPRKKDDLGRSLEDFVGENFLQEQIIRERVTASNITMRLGVWASEPRNARRIVDEVTEVAAIGLGNVRDEHIVELVEAVLLPRFRDEPIAPILGSLLTETLRDDLHHGVVDLALEELQRWLEANEETFTDVLSERAPWWAPPRLNDAITGRLHTEAIKWLADIRADTRHHAREALDSMLTQLAHDLLNDPATQARAEVLKNRILDHPQVTATGVSLWKALRNALLAGLQDSDGPLRERLTAEVRGFAERLTRDAALRARLDGAAADVAVFAVSRYGAEVTAVITSTIERWDGKEAARKIELHVGRDLQFIRINGTIVGGLVGILIHAVSALLN
jgi:uncharacterized membrane-anchored protein YjiN (DUF445 family)